MSDDDQGEARPWAEAPYTRVYHTIAERMGDDWHDDAFLASWLRLLMLADRIYPMPPPLPRWVADDVLRRLVDADLVRLVPPACYTIGGLVKERSEQRLGRRAGGLARAAQAAKDGRGDGGKFVPAGSQQPDQQRGDAGASNDGQQQPATASIDPNAGTSNDQQRRPPADQVRPATTSTSTNTEEGTEVPLRAQARDDDGWRPWRGDRCRPFREAWQARGFRLPPSGDMDDPTSQAGLLWSIVDARPTQAAEWVTAAPPGSKAYQVVQFVIARRDEQQAVDDAATAARNGPSGPGREEAASIVARIGARIATPATPMNGHAPLSDDDALQVAITMVGAATVAGAWKPRRQSPARDLLASLVAAHTLPVLVASRDAVVAEHGGPFRDAVSVVDALWSRLRPST